MTDNRNHLVAAALISLAESILAGVTPVPDSVDVWQHRVTAQQLLTLADAHDLKIQIARNEKDEPIQASVWVPIGFIGAKITWRALCNDVAPERIKFYEAHNAECAVTA